MDTTFFGKLFQRSLFYIFLIELASFCANYFQATINLQAIAFCIILAIVFLLGIKKLEYALYAAILELFIGSMGRLFAINLFGFSLSIRMAIFGIVMVLWIIEIIRKKQYLGIINLIRQNKSLVCLGIVVSWGILFAVITKNGLQNIFSDVNAWIYFLYFLPFLTILQTKAQFNNILQLLSASIVAISLKTFIFLYAFAHALPIVPTLYKWGRDSRWGEFTVVHDNIYRIFSQAQIFLLIGVFMLLGFLFFREKIKIRAAENRSLLILLLLATTVVIVNLSRSFWVAGFGALTMAVLGIFIFLKNPLKKMLSFGLGSVCVLILSYGLILSVLNFPIPPVNWVTAADIFGTRLDTHEPAISSRQSQLKPLLMAITQHPVVGSGWGSEVTYKSQDPRIKNEKNPEGWNTTDAFEWGYLDIILKIGLLGLIIYLILIYNIAKKLYLIYKKNSDPELRALIIGLTLGLIALLGVHMFSPYLNHPLGIGYLLILLIFVGTRDWESRRGEDPRPRSGLGTRIGTI